MCRYAHRRRSRRGLERYGARTSCTSIGLSIYLYFKPTNFYFFFQGTLPFMSLRLMKRWHVRLPYEHTPIDDLESFLWLLIWCIYSIIEDKVRDGTDVMWLKILRSSNVETHASSRQAILAHITTLDDPENVHVSPLETLFNPLLLDWQKILPSARRDMQALLDSTPRSNENFLTTTRKYFGDFLTEGFHHLATLPKDWDSFIPVRNRQRTLTHLRSSFPANRRQRRVRPRLRIEPFSRS